MTRPPPLRDLLGALRRHLLPSALVVPVGLLAGTASACFLWSLDFVTRVQWSRGWLLYLLPLAGVAITLAYRRWGGPSVRGNNLLLEQIHQPGGGVPARMAPLVLLATLVTHLFGGSAGREGTAVQMGGSLADAFRRLAKIDPAHQRVLLLGGVAAGFGAVFGTPVAGAVFALEVRHIGRLRTYGLVPALVAAFTGHLTCLAWGAHHTSYAIAIQGVAPFNLPLLVWVAGAALCFGLAARLFAGSVHLLQYLWAKLIPLEWLRPVAGAAVLIGLVHLLGTRDYLGLGVTGPHPGTVSLLSAFQPGGADAWSWALKLLFTAVTLSCGFKGGEVTPLFFIGATLGHTLAVLSGAPIDLFAGIGLLAVFAGAANTPLACTLLGIELFGPHYTLYFAVACFVAYQISGHRGIYAAQRVLHPKRLP